MDIRAARSIGQRGLSTVSDGVDASSANRWLAALVMRKPKMVAAVALANKMARMIWALTTKEQDYRMA